MDNFQSRLQQLFPADTIGGQCGTFAHKLSWFPPIGDLLSEKISTLQAYGHMGPFPISYIVPGDIIITKENVLNGHVAFVNSTQDNYLILTESNYHLDQCVYHTRKILANDARIIGIFRGNRAFTLQ